MGKKKAGKAAEVATGAEDISSAAASAAATSARNSKTAKPAALPAQLKQQPPGKKRPRPAAEEPPQPSTQDTAGPDIKKSKPQTTSTLDDIFGGVKEAKAAKARREEEAARARADAKAARKRREVNPFSEDPSKLGGREGPGAPERWAWADAVKPVRIDSDGLPIYTMDSLRIGQGGGTDLCPFDCDCCF